MRVSAVPSVTPSHSPAAAVKERQTQPLQSLSRAEAPTSKLASFIDNSPRLVAQNRSRAIIFGPPVLQPRLASILGDSPLLAARAQRSATLFGSPIQKKNPAHPLPQPSEEDNTSQLKTTPTAATPAPAPNRTGLPDQLKSGIESLSGLSMDHVKVHYNSPQPAQLHALAYAQGSHIHIAPGQEQHLPHEAWHVVQQAQGRVKPTLQLKTGVPVNDNAGLEREADVMGAKAIQFRKSAVLDNTQIGCPIRTQRAYFGSSALASPAVLQAWGWGMLNPVNWYHWYYSKAGKTGQTSYRQNSDPSVIPYLKSGEDFMGHNAARKQLLGKVPEDTEVRVLGVDLPGRRQRVGMHECVPTSMRGNVAHSQNEALIGAMSGMRTSTDKQLFFHAGQFTAHSGYAPSNKGGSTHTSGQPAAHDKMRETVRDIIAKKIIHPDEVINNLALQHLSITPDGRTLLDTQQAVGLHPNHDDGLGAIHPPAAGGPPDPQHLRIADITHTDREAVKRRVRGLKRATGRGRSPSPPRRSIDSQGLGGGPILKPNQAELVEEVPDFGDRSNTFEYAAHASAWAVKPQRN